jgi:threonylcarbamoyladenosine tRNA methylthiotransferase MtaB
MQNPIPSEIKKERMVALQLAAEKSQDRFFKQNVGNMVRVLIEENNEQGVYTGFSNEYIRVFLEEEVPLNQFITVELTEPWGEGMKGRLISGL